jgi:hypothetical protein
MNRTDILNHLIDKYKLESYLEIGAGDGYNFYNVKAKTKVGVEPNSNGKDFIKYTSDEYFDMFENSKFDLIFIDGDHRAEQVIKDIENVVMHLTPKGIVVLHDCNPPTEQHASEDFIPGTDWNGTVYRAYIDFMYHTTEFDHCTVDTDWGVGIIVPRRMRLLKPYVRTISVKKVTWEIFEKKRKELLNLVSEVEFKEIFNGEEVLEEEQTSQSEIVNIGYHKTEIPKGNVGEFSKIEEEFLEAKDAYENNNPIMLLTELSDMIGAIEQYAIKHNITLEQLITMKNVTEKVFKKGSRK